MVSVLHGWWEGSRSNYKKEQQNPLKYCSNLTEVAGEGGPHLAPQKFLLSQQFRYLMRCKKYLKKNFLSCLVSEIQLFVYIFG